MKNTKIYEAILEVKTMIAEAEDKRGFNVTVEEFIDAVINEQWPARKSILKHVAAITILAAGSFKAYDDDHVVMQFYMPATSDCIEVFPYVMQRYRRGKPMHVRCWDNLCWREHNWWIDMGSIKPSVKRRKIK